MLRCFHAFIFEYDNILVNIHFMIYNMQEYIRYFGVEYAMIKLKMQ